MEGKAEEIYRRAERNGVYLECTCCDIGIEMLEMLMKGATRADSRRVKRLLLNNGFLSKDEMKYCDMYHHYKTDTHLIYVHSAIEHFFRINNYRRM